MPTRGHYAILYAEAFFILVKMNQKYITRREAVRLGIGQNIATVSGFQE